MSTVIRSHATSTIQKWALPIVSDSDTATIAVENSPAMTDAKLQQLLDEAREEGRCLGLQQASEQLTTELEQNLRQEWQEKTEQLLRLIDAMTLQHTKLFHQLENEMLNLVVVIAKLLFKHELTVAPTAIVKIINEAFALLADDKPAVRIYLNPDDHALVTEQMSQLNKAITPENLVINKELLRGECHVNTPTTQIDASLEARLNAILEQVLCEDD